MAKSWNKWESWGKEGKSWKKLDFFAKWPPAAILDDQKSLFLEKNFKMAAGRHFGIPFWAILDDRKSLSIAFLAISDQYATSFFFEYFFQNGRQRPFWKSDLRQKPIGFFHYVLSMAMPNMKLIGEFVTQLEMPQGF